MESVDQLDPALRRDERKICVVNSIHAYPLKTLNPFGLLLNNPEIDPQLQFPRYI